MRQSQTGLQRLLTFALALTIATTTSGYTQNITPLSQASASQMLQAKGVGKLVKIKEADGTELRARIISLGETSARMQVGSKPPVDVPYVQVTTVKGPGLSRGLKITIIVVAVVWIALLYPATHT